MNKGKEAFDNEPNHEDKAETARVAIEAGLEEAGATIEELRTMVGVFTTGVRPKADLDTVDTL